MTLSNDIVELVSKNFIRTNQFKASIHPPVSVSKERWIDLSIKAVPIPGFGIEGSEDSLGGKLTTHVAMGFTLNSVDLSFYITQGMQIYDMLEEWRKLIVDVPSNRLGYYDDYVGTIEVDIVTRNDRVLKTVEFKKVWPIVVGDTDMSYDTANEVGILQTTFNYHEHEIIKKTGE